MDNIITNLKVYDLEETLVASGYAMIEEYDESTVKNQTETLMGYLSEFNGSYKEDNNHDKRN